MKNTLKILALMLVGCAPLQPRMVGRLQDLAIYPDFNQQTQALVSPLTLSSIASLDIVPYMEDAGIYKPISALTGNPTTYGAADMLKLTMASPSIDPNRPFVLKNLKPNKNYRIFAKAYNTSMVLISLDESSTADIRINADDAPSMLSLPVSLAATPFAASGAVTVSLDGRFDYFKGTLSLLPGNIQVAMRQSTRNRADLLFNNLQGNKDYQLVVEAYKLGQQFASSSLTLGITNDDAPATQSLTFTVPYLVSTFAGSSQGFLDETGGAAKFNNPTGVTVDTLGNLYVADCDNNLIRKITPSGVVSTLAGGAGGTSSGYLDGTGTSAKFNGPTAVAVDASGNVYVADLFNHRIRKITPERVVSTLAGSGAAGSADGSGTLAQFYHPIDVKLDVAGNLYILDYDNQRIRKMTQAYAVSTFAGSTYGTADGSGTLAQFASPTGLAVDPLGNVYVADRNNRRIRKVTPAGMVTTIAGSTIGFAEGTGASAQFSTPWKIAVDGAGNLYVSDGGNNRIRLLR